MFQRILVAVKLSAASAHALKTAATLAKCNRAKLHIFHALDYRLKRDHPDSLKQQQMTEMHLRQEFGAILDDLEDLTCSVYPADPALEVCKLATQTNADLIVLGCHQRPGMISLGRVDYVGMTILEKAPCPVMLVPRVE